MSSESGNTYRIISHGVNIWKLLVNILCFSRIGQSVTGFCSWVSWSKAASCFTFVFCSLLRGKAGKIVNRLKYIAKLPNLCIVHMNLVTKPNEAGKYSKYTLPCSNLKCCNYCVPNSYHWIAPESYSSCFQCFKLYEIGNLHFHDMWNFSGLFLINLECNGKHTKSIHAFCTIWCISPLFL